MKSTSPVPPIRARDFQPVTQGLHQSDTLKVARNLLRELLRADKPTVDPVRVYIGVCRALGEEGTDAQIEAQLY